MDALLDPEFFGPLPDEAVMTKALTLSLDQSRSFEGFLDRTRLFGQEQMFLIGVRVLSGTVSAEQAGEAFARLADVLIRAIRTSIETEFATIHGRLRGQEAAIMALGKLGGREMTAGSDLDLIVVFDFDAKHPDSDGKRSLYDGQYFARLTPVLINALTAQTNYVRTLNLDIRMSPFLLFRPHVNSFETFV